MTNPWISHLKKYHAAHPNLSYKEAMVKAKSSYKPIGGSKSGSKKTSGSKRQSGKGPARKVPGRVRTMQVTAEDSRYMDEKSELESKLKKKYGRGKQKGGNPAIISAITQGSNIAGDLLGKIGDAVQNRRANNGFYEREKQRKDDKQMAKRFKYVKREFVKERGLPWTDDQVWDYVFKTS